jgi:hypothetical protein
MEMYQRIGMWKPNKSEKYLFEKYGVLYNIHTGMCVQGDELHLTTVFDVCADDKHFTCKYDDKPKKTGKFYRNGEKVIYYKNMRYFESRRNDVQSKYHNSLLAKCASENKTVLYAQYIKKDNSRNRPCSIAEYGRFYVKVDEEYNGRHTDKKIPKAYRLIFDESQL